MYVQKFSLVNFCLYNERLDITKQKLVCREHCCDCLLVCCMQQEPACTHTSLSAAVQDASFWQPLLLHRHIVFSDMLAKHMRFWIKLLATASQ